MAVVKIRTVLHSASDPGRGCHAWLLTPRVAAGGMEVSEWVDGRVGG